MNRDELGDALSFVNEPEPGPLSLRPGVRNQSSRWLTLFGASSFFGVALALSYCLGLIQVPALERIGQDVRQPERVAAGPPVPAVPPRTVPVAPRVLPAAPPTITPRIDEPRQVAARTEPPPPQPAARPQASGEASRQSLAKARGGAPATEDGPIQPPAKPAKEILEAKGLKLVGDHFILAEKEQAAATTFNRDLSKFDQVDDMFPKIYQINSLVNMLEIARNRRAGIGYDNADLNIAMNSVPSRGGSREQYLNNVQRGMHDQLLSNQQSMADLDRTIGALNAELGRFPSRAQLVSRYEALFSTCQQSLIEIETEISAVEAEYAQLNNDRTVTDALAEFNRVARTSNLIGPSADFRDARNKLNKAKLFYQPQVPRRTNRRR